ncbi:GNAT family N-acetyltransferase [Flavobacterium sp. 3HN19-14]|uniref:GNAT family N-acetyltransferase n=1 Tax=Flavobacterium sp. 3HN19-14 TaxID=3448133 RepID=UPI003EE17E94
MKRNLIYSEATIADAELLSETAYTSKKNWGYSDELMNLWLQDLTIKSNYITNNKVFKVFNNEIYLGFFAIQVLENGDAEIDHLWLKPEYMRQNFGQEIFMHIMNYLSSEGYEKAKLIAEPNAIGFYQKMGGKVTGKFQSKIPGRILDIYEFQTK